MTSFDVKRDALKRNVSKKHHQRSCNSVVLERERRHCSLMVVKEWKGAIPFTN